MFKKMIQDWLGIKESEKDLKGMIRKEIKEVFSKASRPAYLTMFGEVDPSIPEITGYVRHITEEAIERTYGSKGTLGKFVAEHVNQKTRDHDKRLKEMMKGEKFIDDIVKRIKVKQL